MTGCFQTLTRKGKEEDMEMTKMKESGPACDKILTVIIDNNYNNYFSFTDIA